jgi:phosphoglycolate phosphatase-like HAD superfamily hydrolase
MNLFVFDFHGVLEKGNENAVLEISNSVLAEFSYHQRFTIEDCNKLYGSKWFEYFKYLIPSEKHERYLELQERCFKYQQENPQIVAKHIKPNDHVYDVLETIAKNHTQIVISNTNPESMRFFLDSIGVSSYFPDGNVFAVDMHRNNHLTKEKVLRKYLECKEFEKVIVIGDSPSDISLASVVNGVSYLYSHPGRKFRNADANYKISDLRELLKEV